MPLINNNHNCIQFYLNHSNDKPVTIFAGSCLFPSEEALKNCTTFVGLDNSCLTQRDNFVPLHRLFHIDDNSIPQDPEKFKLFIHELSEFINKGEVLHIGCIGGNGRTGMVLVALIQHFKSNTLQKFNISAIDYVRANYREESVENEEQENFLHEHFNVQRPKYKI